jgi:hypothetical protein
MAEQENTNNDPANQAPAQNASNVPAVNSPVPFPAPVAQAAFPAAAAVPSGPAPAPPATSKRAPHLKTTLIAVLLIVLLGCASFGSYTYGYSRGRATSNLSASTTAADSALQVPKGATIIEQCSVGRGTQYVLPSNIPHGPVFNVYNGKVIGLEYMIGKEDLASAMSFYNLPLYGKTYDHIDIGLLSQGHAGYPVPHYHVDIYNISRAESKAITCKP